MYNHKWFRTEECPMSFKHLWITHLKALSFGLPSPNIIPNYSLLTASSKEKRKNFFYWVVLILFRLKLPPWNLLGLGPVTKKPKKIFSFYWKLSNTSVFVPICTKLQQDNWKSISLINVIHCLKKIKVRSSLHRKKIENSCVTTVTVKGEGNQLLKPSTD